MRGDSFAPQAMFSTRAGDVGCRLDALRPQIEIFCGGAYKLAVSAAVGGVFDEGLGDTAAFQS